MLCEAGSHVNLRCEAARHQVHFRGMAAPRKRTKAKDAITEYLRALGRKGGKARVTGMTADERRESARKAARARWAKEGKRNP